MRWSHFFVKVGRIETPGARASAMQALAASAWVGQGGVALLGVAQGELGGFDLLAGACAGVGQAFCDQRVQRLLVQRAALRLQNDGSIGV